MKALSIRQPWAWLIIRPDLTSANERAAAAGELKDVENRSWGTGYRGPLLIHAGLQFDMDGYRWVQDRFPRIALPEPHRFERGGIIGAARLIDSIAPEDAAVRVSSRWYMGQHALMLADARPLPFLPWKGQLSLFEAGHPGAEQACGEAACP